MDKIVRLAVFLQNIARLRTFPLFVAYLAAVTFVPRFWKKYTRPLEMRAALVGYNMLCSLVNLYITYSMVRALCAVERVYSNEESELTTPALRLYSFTKAFELLDTVFMVLRHKWRQISFLHVYHHSLMMIFLDYAVEHTPFVSMIAPLALNSFVHIVLYFYYGYTAWCSGVQPAWKRRLTELQIFQFVLDLSYATYGLLYRDFCVWSVLYGFSMLYLFSKFYVKAYLTSRPESQHRREVNGKDKTL